MKSITQSQIARYRRIYKEDDMAKTLTAAMAKTDMAELAYLPMEGSRLSGGFSIEVETHGVTWQKNSARCWAFAALNLMRETVMEKCGLKEFELSGNYIAFWDKFEKCNNVLEMAIEYAELPLDDRMMEYILEGIWDGGYWEMSVDLLNKYGIVPASAMPDTYQSSHTATFMRKLNTLLRKDVLELRRLENTGHDSTSRKDEMLAEIFRAECIAFGEPVEKFDFTWRDEDNHFHGDYDLTPEEFYRKYVDIDFGDYIPVSNEPTSKKPLGKAYTFHYLGNMYGRNELFLNLPMEDLKRAAIEQLKDGEPVWFTCDCRQSCDRALGIWDPDSFDYGGLMGGIDLDMSKQERLEYRESSLNHAMLLTGVNLRPDGTPDRYKIENSWGEESGRKGYFVCSDKFFDEYVYQVIVHQRYLTEEQLELLDSPVELLAWDI